MPNRADSPLPLTGQSHTEPSHERACPIAEDEPFSAIIRAFRRDRVTSLYQTVVSAISHLDEVEDPFQEMSRGRPFEEKRLAGGRRAGPSV
jgi:hypothetical protein